MLAIVVPGKEVEEHVGRITCGLIKDAGITLERCHGELAVCVDDPTAGAARAAGDAGTLCVCKGVLGRCEEQEDYCEKHGQKCCLERFGGSVRVEACDAAIGNHHVSFPVTSPALSLACWAT